MLHSRAHTFRTLLLALILSVTAEALHAQDSVKLRELVYTGTLREMRKDEFAIPVEIYPQSHFLKANVNNLYEAVTMISGVQANIDGAVDAAGDIEINGQEGIYTLIMIDGLPISTGNAGLYAMMGIPMAMIERIEVIKGPASTVYGSDAVAGVVNVITKNPERMPSVVSEARYSSYHEANADLAFKIPAGRANGLLSASFSHMGARWDKDHDGFTDIPLITRLSLFSKWSFRDKYQHLSSVYGRYMHEDRNGGELRYTPADAGSDTVYGQSVRTNRFEVYGNFMLPVKSVNISLQPSYIDHAQSSYYGNHLFDNHERNARLQLLFDNKISGKSDLLIGAVYRFYWYTDNLSTPTDTVNGRVNYQPLMSHSPAVFIQDMIHVNANNEILAGIRFEYNTLYRSSTFLPRFDYKWSSTARHDLVRLSFGSGFRSPNVFADDKYAFTNGKRIIISGDIKTELSYGGQLSYEHRINKHGNFNIECKPFFNVIFNKIEIDITSRNDAVIYSNDGSYNLNYGINVNTDLNFTFPLRALVGFTVMRNQNFSKDDQGQTVYEDAINAPIFTANYALSYNFSKIGLSIDWTGLINSPMRLNRVLADYRPASSPWYCIMNLQVTKKFKFGLDIFAGANNLLNFMPRNVLLRPNDPFNRQLNDLDNNPHNYHFDASYIYAPNQGIKGFIGLRYTLK